MTVEEQATTGITDPNDSDVLCGRGGAALRHPGNQTYRRLVNLNKGLYTTCLKTEKLKISRSIVAAIREQQGRFLEKDANNGTWYDIGDKKAIEKTSQALREGQPKLRQKIVEMGGTPALDAQFGLYPEQIGLGLDPAVMMPPPPQHHPLSSPPPPPQHLSQSPYGGPQDMGPPLNQHPSSRQQQQQSQQQQQPRVSAVAAQTAAMREQEMRSMQPPLPDPARQEMHAEMFQRLSLRNLNAADDEDDARLHGMPPGPSHPHHPHHPHSRAARLRPSLTQRHSSAAHELGMLESQLSLASEFSAFAGQSGTLPNESLMSLDVGSFRRGGHPQQPHGGAATGGNSSNHNNGLYSPYGNEGSNGYFATGSMNGVNASYGRLGGGPSASMPPRGGGGGGVDNGSKLAGMDRRQIFSKMKYSRPPSVRNQKMSGASGHNAGAGFTQYSDGMPDIHMVESSLSLYSNLSTMTDGLANTLHQPLSGDLGGVGGRGDRGGDGTDPLPSSSSQEPERAKVVDHSQDINWGGGGQGGGLGGRSNHSLMSGLSRIDDCGSIMDQSIFSDMSKKISNVSTRSVAMSEVSVLDLQERDNEDEDSSSHTGFAHGLEGFTAPIQNRRTEYDLS